MLSIVIPAKNESAGLKSILGPLRGLYPEAEIIVVDDGSTDDTAQVAKDAKVRVLSSPYSMGNGASIKNGCRNASGSVLVFMDGDGQHRPESIALLLAKLEQGYDMVVGARTSQAQASLPRRLANQFYNFLASVITGHPVADLTSGFRAVNAEKFSQFLHMLPNGFSYPTTSTMAFFRSAYRVAFVPVDVEKRRGATSHIRPLKDGVRFLLIIFKIATLYSPLKLFVPVAAAFFASGFGYYLYTYLTQHRFTNMSVLLLSGAVIVFLIGLVSEQITNLLYQQQK